MNELPSGQISVSGFFAVCFENQHRRRRRCLQVRFLYLVVMMRRHNLRALASEFQQFNIGVKQKAGSFVYKS